MGPFEKTLACADAFLSSIKCTICAESTDALQNVDESCKHLFCWSCIQTLKKKTKGGVALCPVCFVPFNTKIVPNKLTATLHQHLTALKTCITQFSQMPRTNIVQASQALLDVFEDVGPKRTVEEFIATQVEPELTAEDEFKIFNDSVDGNDVLPPSPETSIPGKPLFVTPTIRKRKGAAKISSPRLKSGGLFASQMVESTSSAILDNEWKDTIENNELQPTPVLKQTAEKKPSIFSSPRNRRMRQLAQNDRRSGNMRRGELNVLNAVYSGDFSRLKSVLQNKGNPNERDGADGATPLYAAAHQGETEMCKELIKSGAVVNAHCTSSCDTPLHAAARNGHLETLQLLLSLGADDTTMNIRRETLFDVCVSTQMRNEVREMLKTVHTPRTLRPLSIVIRNLCIIASDSIDPELRSKAVSLGLFQTVTDVMDDQTTHVIIPGVSPSGIAAYSPIVAEAMARGVMILSVAYLEECVKRRMIPMSETTYEVQSLERDDFVISESTGKCREARLRRMMMKPRLFSGAHFFMASKKYFAHDVNVLKHLIECAGGEITLRVPHADPKLPPAFYDDKRPPFFIVACPSDTNSTHVKNLISKQHVTLVSPTWIIDCIIQARFLRDVY